MFKRTLAAAVACAAFSALALAADAPAGFPADYKGTPYADDKVTGGAQKIPGKVFCAYYDVGGEGVSYHDLGKKNEGSGGLNGGGKNYVDMFRRADGVDISYTKDFADKWEGQKVTPEMGLLYVGWTDAGEWLNYTVDVAEDGVYTVDILYTSNKGGELSLDVNGKKAAEAIKIETTNDPKDTTGWRQWHHWNINTGTEIKLSKGKNLLTLHIEKEGNMNLCTMEFKLKK
jgi:hypothetical protein